MTTHNLRRWGAILLTGGLLLTAAYLIHPSNYVSAILTKLQVRNATAPRPPNGRGPTNGASSSP